MSLLRRFVYRVNGVFRRRSVEGEFDEEIRYHLEREAARRMANGMDPIEARLSTRRDFGNPTLIAEDARASWRVEWLERFVQDVRFSLRSFARTRGFVATVVLTIGLGLGLLTAAFTVFDTYVLTPNAVREPRGLYEVWLRDHVGKSRDFSWREYQAMREANPAFSDVFSYRWFTTRLDGKPLLVQGVSGNFFTGLGVTAALGRTLIPGDASAPGREPVAVLSYRTWSGRYLSDSSVIGRVVRVNGVPLQIVGVVRRGFEGLDGVPPDFWVPITIAVGIADEGDPFAASEPAVLRVIGRLKTGHTERGALSSLAAWGRELTRTRPFADRVESVRLMSRATPASMVPQLWALVVPIIVAFVLVLVIACANVANVMLARGMARQREIGVRLTLGAGRGRLVRQLLTEALVLAIPAGFVAFGISRFALGGATWAMLASLPANFVPYVPVLRLTPDARVFAFLMGAAVVSAILFGLTPALQATRARVVEATRGDFDSSFRPSRLRSLLIALQVMFTVLLLICAGVLLRGAQHVGTLDTGVRTHGLLELQVMEPARVAVVRQLGTEPEVSSYALSAHAPVGGGVFPTMSVSEVSSARLVVTHVNSVSPNFFDVVGLPIVRGRHFHPDEGASHAAVAIVSATAARRIWPNGGAVGSTLTLHPNDSTPARVVQVIGISNDMVPGTMHLGVENPIVFLPASLNDAGTLMLRVKGDPERTRLRVEQSLEERLPGAVNEFHTGDETVAMQTYPFRFGHWLATMLGVVALLLTVTGIYGVVSYVVAQRTKEFGIRLALGATTGRVMFLVTRDLFRLAAWGGAVGVTLSLGISHVFASQIIAFNTYDPMAYLGGLTVAALACLCAAVIPSRRVGAVDPVRALKSD